MNKRRLILRIIISPMVFGLLLITYQLWFLKHFIGFIRYGGEWLTYEKEDPKRMREIYELLKEIKNK